jgi:hypothetical protein
MRHVRWSSLVAATVLAAPLSAATYYVPSPSTGSTAGLQTTLEIANTGTVSGQISLQFIPTGSNGTAVAGTSGAGFAPNRTVTYDATRLIPGSGLLRVVTNGVSLGDAAFYLNSKSENAAWWLPVARPSNIFAAKASAYVEDLRRNSDGVSNVEIMNVSSNASSCEIQLFDPAGKAIDPAIEVDVQPLSSAIAKDVLGASNVTSMLGGSAQVSCTEDFFTYGTFVSPSFDNFRILPALAAPPAPPGPPVVVNMPGLFLNSTAKNPALVVTLPLTPGVAYRRASIDFDLFVNKYTPLFTGVLGMYHPGGPRFGKTLYFGFNIRGNRGRILADLGQATLEAAVKRDVAIAQRSTYHVKVIYDTAQRGTLFYITDASTGKAVLDALAGVFNPILEDTGNAPVRIQFGLPGVADQAYYPPIGWKFSNLHVVVTP